MVLNSQKTRVLGVDTSLRSSGLAVVESSGNRFRSVEFCTVKLPAKAAVSACLSRIYSEVGGIIDRCNPSEIAIEGAFFFENSRTAMILGQARGAVLAVCGARGIPVYEYSPRRVKQAVTGHGGAGKDQVRKMVTAMLGLGGEVGEDCSDAMAIAICHMNSRKGASALLAKPL